VKAEPDHTALAQRYLDCAWVHVCRADRMVDAADRSYHIASANEYLLLAEGELGAGRGPPTKH
jgi:hypothetical protein